MRRTNTRWLFASAAAVAVALTLTCPARAAETTDPGRAAYLKYCSACHGESGKGDGVVSGFMTPHPTDLTLMAKQAGGGFPVGEVMQAIDGTKNIAAHGSSDMPVWGELLKTEQSASGVSGSSAARAKVELITTYLRSIQAK